MNRITITFSSATYAAKAQRLLMRINIPSKLVKVDGNSGNGECTHGITISQAYFFDAVGTFKAHGINYSVAEG